MNVMTKFLMLLSFLSLALSSVAFSSMAGPADDAFQLEQRGTELRLAGDFEQAMLIQEQLLAVYDEPVGHIFAINTIVTHLTWDETSTLYDDALNYHAGAVFAWSDANPLHPHATYFSGQAHFAISFHHGLKGNYYRAGRHGTQGIRDLENALTVDPTLVDAKMHLGVAYFVADNLPPFIKMFSHLLWFIPSGNSEKSLPYLRDVMNHGKQYRDVARYIYSTLLLEREEGRDEAELELRYLVDNYPTNSRFQLRLISLLLMQEKFTETLTFADRYLNQQPAPVEPDNSLARIWMVRAHMGLNEPVAANLLFEQIDPVFTARAEDLPGWSLAWHKLTAGQLSDLANRREKALDIYREILRIARSTYVNEVIKEAARDGLVKPYTLTGN